MNEERNRLWFRQTEHIRGHLRHTYSEPINQVMVATVKFRSDDINLITRNPWSEHSLLAGTIYHEIHDRNHKLWNIGSPRWYDYTSHAGSATMLTLIQDDITFIIKWAVVVVIAWQLDNQCLSTTNVVRSNSANGEVYSMQHYVIKFLGNLWQVCGFSGYSGFLHHKEKLTVTI